MFLIRVLDWTLVQSQTQSRDAAPQSCRDSALCSDCLSQMDQNKNINMSEQQQVCSVEMFVNNVLMERYRPNASVLFLINAELR